MAFPLILRARGNIAEKTHRSCTNKAKSPSERTLAISVCGALLKIESVLLKENNMHARGPFLFLLALAVGKEVIRDMKNKT